MQRKTFNKLVDWYNITRAAVPYEYNGRSGSQSHMEFITKNTELKTIKTLIEIFRDEVK